MLCNKDMDSANVTVSVDGHVERLTGWLRTLARLVLVSKGRIVEGQCTRARWNSRSVRSFVSSTTEAIINTWHI